MLNGTEWSTHCVSNTSFLQVTHFRPLPKVLPPDILLTEFNAADESVFLSAILEIRDHGSNKAIITEFFTCKITNQVGYLECILTFRSSSVHVSIISRTR